MGPVDDDDEYGEYEGYEEPRPRASRTPAEGVRIIGAEEAAAALETGSATGRRPDDAPRFGDVPPAPSGPRPAARFPLPESVDPAAAVPRPSVAGPTASGPGEVNTPDLPHWTEPATGEVPSVLASENDEDDVEAWAGFSQPPRWRDQQTDWEEVDFEDASALADEDMRQGVFDPNRTEHSDLYSFDEPLPPREPDPTRIAAPTPPRRVIGSGIPRHAAEEVGVGPEIAPVQRDIPTAVIVGLGLGALALICFRLGPAVSLVLVGAVIMLAAVEVFDVLRKAGHRPATLVGLTATASLLVAAYNKGETAVPLVLALTVVTTFLWFLFGVERARPMVNIAVTLFGFLWVGVLGSFGALLLAIQGPEGTEFHRAGVAFLLGAVLATVANDVGALVFGRQVGTRPMAPEVSPNKTWEGIVGGGLASIAISVLILGFVPGLAPWDGGKAFWLGLTVAVVAPLGDLCQSMIKRDLGLKDTGTILPGHGGVLDRFDAMLFVLPATYYLVRILFF